MKILITGGTGVLSSGIVRESVKSGYETYAVTRGNKNYRNIDGAVYLYADLMDKESLNQAIGDMVFDVVVECLVYNVTQLKISLDNFAGKCKQYIFISTTGVYSGNKNLKIKESDIKDNIEWKYSHEKIECEHYLINFCKINNLKYTIIRAPVTYGDYRVPFPIATRNPAWTFFQRLKDGKPMLACENVKFPVIHIDDFSYAVIHLFGNKKAINEDFNVAIEESLVYWDDIIRIAADILCVKPIIIHVPLEVYKLMYPQFYEELKWNKTITKEFDCSKICNVVEDYKQKINIYNGLKLIIDNMYAEYVKEKLLLDEKWNKGCDLTIIYALSKSLLMADESADVEMYLRTLSKSEKIQILSEIRLNLVKNRIKAFIRRYKF